MASHLLCVLTVSFCSPLLVGPQPPHSSWGHRCSCPTGGTSPTMAQPATPRAHLSQRLILVTHLSALADRSDSSQVTHRGTEDAHLGGDRPPWPHPLQDPDPFLDKQSS